MRKIFPYLAIYILGLALVWSTSMQGNYLVGSDIYVEWHWFQIAMNQGWNVNYPSTINSCISIMAIAPLLAKTLSFIDPIWIFKAVFPAIFAIVPVILYIIYKRQMSQAGAFLATLFFMLMPTFFLELPALGRQQLAEVFLALTILVLITDMNWKKKVIIGSSCAVMISLCHYATGMVAIIYLILLVPVLLLLKWWRGIKTEMRSITAICAVFVVVSMSWFVSVASGINFRVMTRVATEQTILQVVPEHIDIPQPKGEGNIQLPRKPDAENRDSLVKAATGLDFLEVQTEGKIFRILQFITELFIVIGFLVMFLKRSKFRPEFIALGTISCLLLVACVLWPGFAQELNMTRIYHITLMTLAPAFVVGGQWIENKIRSRKHDRPKCNAS